MVSLQDISQRSVVFITIVLYKATFASQL